MSKRKKKKSRELPQTTMLTGSADDCTGLIPAGDDLTEEEYQAYQELYPFGPPISQ